MFNILKNLLVEYKKDILLSIIVGLLTIFFIEPIATPLKALLFQIVANFIVIIFNNFKDYIYSEVSKGFHAQPAFFVLMLLLSGFGGLIMGRLFRANNLNDKAKGLQIKNLLPHMVVRRFFVCYLIFIFMYLLFISLSTSYINHAVWHFEQLMTVNGPAIDNVREEELRSKFVQIRHQSDYTGIISDLENLAKSHNRTFRNFKSW